MKKLIKFPLFILLLTLSGSILSCDSDDDFTSPDPGNSAYDLTQTNANFSILGQAIDAAGLRTTLDGSGNFTVFAPTNAAFQAFLSDNNFASLNDVPVDVLRNTLLNHVLDTEVRSTMLTQGYVKTSATDADGNNLDAFINLQNGVTVNSSEVDTNQVDIDVDNGVVHVVNDVIALPTVVDLAVANPNFGNLVTAVTQENLAGALAETSTSAAIPAPFTVFAPTNASFQNLIAADPNDGLNNINDVLALPNLSDILLYHVVSGAAVRAEDIMDGQTVDPITQGTFTISTSNGVVITDGTGTETTVVATNVTAINGVIHAIDFVLRP
ncbi:fasciclin domain-containing protein [Nonlabens xiamenensis]|uniref:fasciclin domain-containing protein n=1 Tax=Nonlabens xiamenensis TaxID=2341043 RepID=UPI000F60E6D4|nr:fasciclin domain-containing protein [Nonlabens xiamenensis]